MSTRKPATGIFLSLLLSLAVYAAIGCVLAWIYYAANFAPRPDVIWSPSPGARVLRFLLVLGWFAPAILIWWLTVFLAGRRQTTGHRLAAPADLWLLLAALIWSLMIFALAMGRFPLDYHDCGQFMQVCTRPRPLWFWGLIGVAAAIFLFGLVRRVKGIGPPEPPDPAWLSRSRQAAAAGDPSRPVPPPALRR